MEFQTKRLPVARDDVAPDGSDVRILLSPRHGGMAHFELGPSQTSRAVAHRTIEEVWFVLRGRGEMWRKHKEQEEVVPLDPGVCLTIPVGTQFQFRSFGYKPLPAIGITMPPWPGGRGGLRVLASEIAKMHASPEAGLSNWLAQDLSNPGRVWTKFRPSDPRCPREHQ